MNEDPRLNSTDRVIRVLWIRVRISLRELDERDPSTWTQPEIARLDRRVEDLINALRKRAKKDKPAADSQLRSQEPQP